MRWKSEGKPVAVDKRAVVAIIILALMLIVLVTGLFVFLSSMELPVLNIAGTVESLSVPSEYRPYHTLTLEYEIGDAVLKDAWIYFAGVQGSTILLQRMRLDASVVETVLEIPEQRTAELVAGFDLRGDGTIRLVIRDSEAGGRLIYAEYDRSGNLIVQRELRTPSFFAAGEQINRYIVSFLEDGSILLDGHDGQTCAVFLYFFGADGSLISRQHTICGTSALTRDGRVIFSEAMSMAAYELDPATGDWHRQPFADDFTVRRLYTGAADSNFDFYIDVYRNGVTNLYGFLQDTGERVHLMDWSEPGFRPRFADAMVAMPDGRVVLFRRNQSNWRTGTFVLVFGAQQVV